MIQELYYFDLTKGNSTVYDKKVDGVPPDYRQHISSFGVETIYYKRDKDGIIRNVICDAFTPASASKSISDFLSLEKQGLVD